jgi:hypothetical protein
MNFEKKDEIVETHNGSNQSSKHEKPDQNSNLDNDGCEISKDENMVISGQENEERPKKKEVIDLQNLQEINETDLNEFLSSIKSLNFNECFFQLNSQFPIVFQEVLKGKHLSNFPEISGFIFQTLSQLKEKLEIALDQFYLQFNGNGIFIFLSILF